MKRIIIFFTMILLFGFGVNAQTLSTDTFNQANGNMPAVGANFDVPVDVTGIGTMYTLTVYVEYDNTVLTYTGSANAVPNAAISEQTANVIKIEVGDFPNSSTIADGKLVVDASINIEAPVCVSSEVNAVVQNGVPMQLMSIGDGEVEYRVFQTISGLTGKCGA